MTKSTSVPDSMLAIEPVQVYGHILVVDDEDLNRELLRELLEADGHSVGEARNGMHALTQVAKQKPDLLLLDVMMPEMDGFEVCRLLKNNDETAAIPVIMVTSLNDREDRLKGIQSGAQDFLTKPIDAQDVKLRSRNAISAKYLHDRVQEDLIKLQELEEMRENLVHMIVHDMRNSLTGLLGRLELIQIETSNSLKQPHVDDLEAAISSAEQVNTMVTDLLDLSRLEAGKMPLETCQTNLFDLMKKTLTSLDTLAQRYDIQVQPPTQCVNTICDPNLIRRTIENLLGNAFKFTPTGGRINIDLTSGENHVEVSVRDSGPGISAKDQKLIFSKFGQASLGRQNRTSSSGIGLAFCKQAIEAHGGLIWVESSLGMGSTFAFSLPTGNVCDTAGANHESHRE